MSKVYLVSLYVQKTHVKINTNLVLHVLNSKVLRVLNSVYVDWKDFICCILIHKATVFTIYQFSLWHFPFSISRNAVIL